MREVAWQVEQRQLTAGRLCRLERLGLALRVDAWRNAEGVLHVREEELQAMSGDPARVRPGMVAKPCRQ